MAKEEELNVIIQPPPEIAKIAIDLSKSLAGSYQTNFVLDGQNTFPHITIYQARFPEKNFDAINFNLKVIAQRMSPFQLSLNKFSTYKGYILWNCDLTNELSHLINSVVYQLNPLRNGLIANGLKTLSNLNLGETYDIQNYGSLVVGRSIQPHITITKMVNENDSYAVFQNLRPRITKFMVDKMHIGTLGPFGTVTEIIEGYPLGKK